MDQLNSTTQRQKGKHLSFKEGGIIQTRLNLERQTRKYILVKIAGKTAAAVMDGFEKVRKYFGSKFSDVFKSITTDNGSEFTELNNLEKDSKTLVYYAHPYSSCDELFEAKLDEIYSA